MPNVPRVPGVPMLRSYSAASIILIAGDLLRALTGLATTRWGIFRNGVPVLVADNVVSFEFKQEFSLSDYPVEQGGFQSYNKVQIPSEIRVRVSAGGSDANRQAFLASIADVINTTDLYDVVTPETVYIGYNFSHRDFRREAREGLGLITVDLWLTEIRQTATATFTSTQQPGVAGRQANGNVQAVTPATAVSEAVGDAGVR